MKKRLHLFTLSLLAAAASVSAQGPLAPTAGPAPVMKSLDQIEPRTPVSSLPFVITQPGSYYLTGNLQFSAATGHAITIQASDVTLDLNGFTLSSTAAVTGDGVHVPAGFGNHRIRNGSITGTTVVTVITTPTFSASSVKGGFENGITARDTCEASDLVLSGCRSTGFFGGGADRCERLHLEHNGSTGAVSQNGSGITSSMIRHSIARHNEASGISGFTSVQGCSATRNGSAGLSGGSVVDSTVSRCLFGILAATVQNCTANDCSLGIQGSAVQNCTASGNTDKGISGGTVSQCAASHNIGTGIDADVISDCSAVENKGNGFRLRRGATIRNSQAFQNEGIGIESFAGCTVVDNACYENGTGIAVTTGCTVERNTCTFNKGAGITVTTGGTVSGNTCASNLGHGISAGSENQIKGNTCDKNGTGAAVAAGIHTTGGDNRIEANACTENDRGLHMTNSGSLILRNTCASNTVVNYDIAASNRVGPIVSAPVSPAISGSTGGAGVGSENPWANFSF